MAGLIFSTCVSSYNYVDLLSYSFFIVLVSRFRQFSSALQLPRPSIFVSLTTAYKTLLMLRKVCCIVILIIGVNTTMKAQRFMQSAGAMISVMHARGIFDGVSQSLDIVLTDLSYFPRINVSEMDNASISVGIPLSVGVGLASDYTSNGKGVYWNFDLPLVADYNIGCKSTPKNEKKFGGYVGAGFGYTYTSWSFDDKSSARANSFGPLIRGGFRFGFPSSDKGQGFTVGLYYKFGLESEHYKTIGCNLLIDF